MEDLKNKIEAVLFTVARALTIEEIGRFTGVGSLGLIKDSLQQLKKEYDDKNSSLQITIDQEKWRLNIKKEYLYLTESLLSDAELSKPIQETLAVIAHKQPSLQSDVIKIRGVSAYDHIKILQEEGFITSEKSGRSRIIKITPKFYDYFNVVEGNLSENLIISKNEV
ncbi:SMC-Scp complex subunit ScpB [Candidatus Woesearchaeota archaeon]|nr:SMC-Scp complex subunit ScpB [Candidatus Woesearchaeota archaeon]